MPKYLLSLLAMAFFLGMLNSCGEKPGSASDPALGQVESAFRSAAAEHRVSYRFMLAVAYMESQIDPKLSSSIYVNRLNTQDERERTIGSGETLFGLPRSRLGIASDSSGDVIALQVSNYAKFVAEKLSARQDINTDPQTIEEKVRYVWELAKLHRPGSENLKDLRLVFAKELLAVVNEGFEHQMPVTGELIRLEKEPTEINETNIPADMQRTFRLSSIRGEIRPAVLFSLASPTPSSIVNNPTGVMVIHCPFSLSACLDMQILRSEGQTRLGAHYLITPNTDIASPGILQVALHKEAVPRINEQGELDYVQDAIVVMLVGSSGRIIKGVRNPARPEWLSDRQLQLMGTAIAQICDALADPYGVDPVKCKTIESSSTPRSGRTSGVTFKHQIGDNYSWGDIPDFDESIFTPYIVANGGLSGDTKFEFDRSDKRFSSGEVISFGLAFQPRVRKIEVERLVRCRSNEGRVVWESRFTKEVRKETRSHFDLQLYDAGPNSNGDQFIRAKVYGDDDLFLGWAIERLNIRNYEKNEAGSYGRACSRTNR